MVALHHVTDGPQPGSARKIQSGGRCGLQRDASAYRGDLREGAQPERSANDAEYTELHGPNPAARTIVRTVQTLADNEELGRQINSMRWAVLSETRPKFELLTSDRPMLVTNGIGPPSGELLIPISPFHLFVAVNNIETENKIRAVWRHGDAIAHVNDRVASQARKYAYGSDDTQLKFVSKRLGRKYTADPTEGLSFDALVAAARAATSSSES